MQNKNEITKRLPNRGKIAAAIAVIILMVAFVVAGAMLGIASDKAQPSAEAAYSSGSNGLIDSYYVRGALHRAENNSNYMFDDEMVFGLTFDSAITNIQTPISNAYLYTIAVDGDGNTFTASPQSGYQRTVLINNGYPSYDRSSKYWIYSAARPEKGYFSPYLYRFDLYPFLTSGSYELGKQYAVRVVMATTSGYFFSPEFRFTFNERTMPADPVQEGYTFNGWYYDEALTIPYAEGDTVYLDTELYPKFTINTYTVSYYIDGVQVFNGTLDYGTELTAPTVTGYNFAGWYRDASFTLTHNGTVTSDVTLYAKYTPKPFNVTVYGYEGVILTEQTKNYNTNFNLATLTIPNVVGHTFAGWYLDSDFQEATNNVFTVYDNIAIYAKYTLNTYTVTIYGLNGTVIMSEVMDYGEVIDTSEGPEIEGYTYIGMYEDQSYTIPFTGTMVTSNITAYAKFTPIMYEYHIYGFGGSELQEGYVAYGTDIDPLLLVAPAVPNRSFLGWYTDAELTSEYDAESLVTGDTSIYAKYSGISYTLTVYGPEGVISTQIFEDTLLVDAAILTAPEYDGLTFVGWYTNSSYTDSFGIGTTILTNTSIYAKYTGVEYTINLYGLLTTPIRTTTVVHGALINPADLTPPLDLGYTFYGWYTDPEFKNEFDPGAPVIFSLNVYAKYIRNHYLVSAYASVTAEVPFFTYDAYHGVQLTQRSLTLADKPGYTFLGWYSDRDLTISVSFPLNITSVINLYPKYAINEYRYNIFGFNSQLLHTGLLNHGDIIPASNFVAPAIEGYTFAGWYRDSSLTTPYSTNATLTSAVNVYGKYTLKKCSVTVYGFGGIVTYSGSVDYGTTVPAAALHVNQVSGYTFAGYFVGQAGSSSVFSANSGIYADTEVYLNYNKNRYHYQIIGFDNEVLSSGDVYYGDTIPAVTAPVVSGYAFVDWYSDPSFVSTYSFAAPMRENLWIYAKYSAEVYTYAFLDSVDQATISSGTYIYGNTVSLPTARSHEGYIFNGWFFANSETPYDINLKYHYDYVVEAKYTRITYTYTLTSEHDYSYTGIVNHGEAIPTPTAPAVTGYVFEGWYTDSGYTAAYDFSTPVTADISLYGKYVIDPNITYASDASAFAQHFADYWYIYTVVGVAVLAVGVFFGIKKARR